MKLTKLLPNVNIITLVIVSTRITANMYTVKKIVKRDNAKTQNVTKDILKNVDMAKDVGERIHVDTNMKVIKKGKLNN